MKSDDSRWLYCDDSVSCIILHTKRRLKSTNKTLSHWNFAKFHQTEMQNGICVHSHSNGLPKFWVMHFCAIFCHFSGTQRWLVVWIQNENWYVRRLVTECNINKYMLETEAERRSYCIDALLECSVCNCALCIPVFAWNVNWHFQLLTCFTLLNMQWWTTQAMNGMAADTCTHTPVQMRKEYNMWMRFNFS